MLRPAVAEVPPPLPSPSPPHAASAALNDTAPAEASKVRRLTGNCGDDVAMVNSVKTAEGPACRATACWGQGGIERGAGPRGCYRRSSATAGAGLG